MDMTTRKSAALAMIVQASLRFGRRPVMRMRRAAVAGHRAAISGR
jgi:hypothetical protein